MELGKRIATIRKEQGMSQEQFGQLFHVTRQTVSNWENEKSFPDLQTLVKISDMFEVSMDELLKENAPMVQKIDWERKVGELFKKLFIATGVVLLLAIFIVPVLKPPVTPEAERNISYTTAKVYTYLNFPEAMPSRAIVRTYEKENYDKFSEKKLEKIYEETSGRMEGDAPSLHLTPDGQKFWVVMQNYAHNNITLDAPPKFYLKRDGVDVDYQSRIQELEGTLVQEGSGYSLWLDSLFTMSELTKESKSEFGGRCMEKCRLELYYQVSGQEYVSVTTFFVFYDIDDEKRV